MHYRIVYHSRFYLSGRFLRVSDNSLRTSDPHLADNSLMGSSVWKIEVHELILFLVTLFI